MALVCLGKGTVQKLKISSRILVAKTFLLSQVVFLLETIPLRFETGERINRIMANFVKGSDRVIAKNRWFLSIELGGYGLVDIHVLNNCVKANWINRWVVNRECADIIGYRGNVNFEKPVDQWCVDETIAQSDKLKYSIMCEWRHFKQQFYRVQGNIGNACLFENDGILAGRKNIGITVFGMERYNNISVIKKLLPVKSFFRQGSVKPKMEMEQVIGMQMNMAEYFRLRNVLSEIGRIYGDPEMDGKCLDMFMRGRKRKGGELRRSVSTRLSQTYLRNDPRNVPSAITLWGDPLNVISRNLIEANFGLWGLSCLSAEFRMFIFNYLQGRLYLNNVLSRIDNTPPMCTFCEIIGKKELDDRGIGMDRPEYQYYLNMLPSESVEHFFWQCDISFSVIQKSYRWIRGLDWYNGVETIERVSFQIGIDNLQKSITIADLIWKHYVRYFLYCCRARRKIPQFPSLKYEMECLFKNPGMYRWLVCILQINNIY